MKFFRRSLFDLHEDVHAGVDNGVLVLSLCSITKVASDTHPTTVATQRRSGARRAPTYPQCKGKFFKCKNRVLKRYAYFCAGQGVRWSTARQRQTENVLVGFENGYNI